MRVAYLAAGAGGMYCGSCMRDNRLAATLTKEGRDIVLVPLYTPLRTDEVDVSSHRVYYGGINVYLQQHSALFRHTPGTFDRILDTRPLLRGVGRLADRSRPEDLGALTVSVIEGENGAQRKELDKLINGLRSIRPDLINLPNLMFVGVARRIKESLGVPVLCTLGGEDIFLDRLIEPHRRRAFDLIRQKSCDIDGFVAVTQYFASHAAAHFHLPGEKIHHVPMGIGVDDFSAADPANREPFTIGYLARICPEKGLKQLGEAFVRLRGDQRRCRLRVAGYLGHNDRGYFDSVVHDLRSAGVLGDFDYLGEVSRQEKIQFLRSLQVLSVPTVYRESKGFYILEALAAGVPVVQPRHGSFSELIEQTGGGLLYDPGAAEALDEALARLMDDEPLRRRLAGDGRDAVRQSFTDEIMARRTWALYERYMKR